LDKVQILGTEYLRHKARFRGIYRKTATKSCGEDSFFMPAFRSALNAPTEISFQSNLLLKTEKKVFCSI
jgi:hypothetical protein